VGKRLSRPIYDLMDATRAVGEGQFDVRLRERRHDEIGYLMDAFNHMGQGLLEKSQVESVFSRFVPKNVAQQMLANLDQIQLGGQRVVGSVLFADIVDYTGISEKLPPEEVAQLLNDYFGLMTQAAMLHGGMVDKFIGDCAMIVFGVPEADPRHHLKAIGCAVFLQKVLAEMNRHRVSKGLPAVEVRMGVNSGEMLAGNLGSDQQMQYTVVGDSVNLASRLSSVAEANQIVVREDLLEWPEVDARFETRRHRRLRLRGMEGEVTTWLVLDTRGAWKRAMERRVDEFLAERGAA
jgi:adenylate cyclase